MTYDCLIIDDETLLADSTAEYFNLFGVKTAIAYSVSECRNFFNENTAQMLLLDINLGDGSGFELCKELRKIPKFLYYLSQHGQVTMIKLSPSVSAVTIIFKNPILSVFYWQR